MDPEPGPPPFLAFAPTPPPALGAWPLAGRGVRGGIAGGPLEVGSPIAPSVARELERSGGEVELIEGPAARERERADAVFRARATIVVRVVRALRGAVPVERLARDEGEGRRAAAALDLAVTAMAWHAPLHELVTRHLLDPDLQRPALRRAAYAAVCGARLGWPDRVLADIALGAALAGVGLLTVPRGVVEKPGRLSPVERRTLQRHPAAAAALLGPILGPVCPLAPRIALEQAERFDGTGHPAGLAGAAIRPEAQVVAVAARYLAAVSDRPYRAALRPHEAAEVLMSEAGRLAHPTIVTAFLESVAAYPVGTMVRLSDRRAGRVRAPGTGTRPVVVVHWDPDGRPCDQVEVDLAAKPTLFIESVAA
jgi:HD-GYP domain-containing protein (c-di-GMP phosphodiesterase class II)